MTITILDLRRIHEHACAARQAAYKVHVRSLACEEATWLALCNACRELNVCSGCDAPYERCGPTYWETQRKCCPDCSHVAPGTHG